MALFPRSMMNDLRSTLRLLDEPFFTNLPRTFGQFNTPFQPVWPTPRFNASPSDLREEGNNYLVETEMPGVRKQDVTVEFSEGGEVLHINGTRGRKVQEVPKVTSSSEATTMETVPDKTSALDITSKGKESAVDVPRPNSNAAVIPAWANESTFSSTYVRLAIFYHAPARLT